TETDDGIIVVSSSPLMWQKHRSSLFSSREEADRYVEELELGGYTDWRLPTREELLDFYFVFDFGDADAGEYGIRIEGDYWSADKDGIGFSGGWKDDGEFCEITRGYQPAARGYVRAVRP
ncbi:MAG: DUF1566 domain-containing protein, partial [Desulfurivibrionaceae bacterium]